MHSLRLFLLWWGALTLLWLELVSSATFPVVVAGIAAAALAAGAGLLGHTTQEHPYSFDVRWLRWLLLAIPSTFVDTARMAQLIFRSRSDREAGTLRQHRLPQESADRAAGRRAVAVIALGLAPSSYVANIDGDRLLVHELPGSNNRILREICR
jgi:hypothetical protein